MAGELDRRLTVVKKSMATNELAQLLQRDGTQVLFIDEVHHLSQVDGGGP